MAALYVNPSLISTLPTHQPTPPARYTPDLIKGDLDSLREDVCAYYSSQGVRIVRDEDQDTTDLMKCIAALVDDEKAERHVEVRSSPPPQSRQASTSH